LATSKDALVSLLCQMHELDLDIYLIRAIVEAAIVPFQMSIRCWNGNGRSMRRDVATY
jgi:hypothetical protein